MLAPPMVIHDAPRWNSMRPAVTPASGAEKSDVRPATAPDTSCLTLFDDCIMALVFHEQC